MDDRGPRREFFALQVFTKSCLFAGWPNNVVPLHSVETVAANKFYIIGKMITTCLVQGGEPPVCFAEAVAEYIINGEINCSPCIEDVPDNEVQEKLTKVYTLFSLVHTDGMLN